MAILIHFFGREWIEQFVYEINFATFFSNMNQVHTLATIARITPEEQVQLNQLLTRYKDIFSEVAGKLTGPSATVHLKPRMILREHAKYL